MSSPYFLINLFFDLIPCLIVFLSIGLPKIIDDLSLKDFARDNPKYLQVFSILKNEAEMDKSMLFVTYVGLSSQDMEFIRHYIESKVRFDKIYFQKASPAIAVNSGAGTFGLLYKTK